ncbi:MAG: HAD hydrolase family protein, partial [Clostridiales bacterium]|nr:HAD hydrolase family protein [Clostridiales bacterium]
MSLPVRLIATDMDGTLLSSSRVIPRENADAIRAAQEKGIVVAMATGRFPLNAALVLEQYGLSCPIIGINGGHIVDAQIRVIRENFMLPEAAERVQAALE